MPSAIRGFLKEMTKHDDFSGYDSVAALNGSGNIFLAGGVAGFLPVAFKEQAISEACISSYAETHGLKKLISAYKEAELPEPWISEENILPVSGGTAAIYAVIADALHHAGKQILIFTPRWSIYDKIITELGGDIVYFPASADGEAFEAGLDYMMTKDTAAFLIASPLNPTGKCLKREQIQTILNLTRKKNVQLVVDETYHGLEYGEGCSVLDVAGSLDRVAVVRSLSKFYCMPGLRIGFVIAAKEQIECCHETVRAMYLSASNLSQEIAAVLIGKIRHSQWHMERCFPKLQKLRELVSRHPCIRMIEPDSAFFVCFALNGNDGRRVSAQELFESAGVVARDCSDFKMEGFLRINLCCSDKDFEGFMERLELFCENLARCG